MNRQYAENLSRMIQAETISESENSDAAKFRNFHNLLREIFPTLFGICEFTEYKGSFLMRWPGKNPSQPENQGLLLMNHHDVVPAEGDWLYPPFSGEITEDKIWGRGALDDKGPLWAMLQAAEELAAAGFVPEKDIWFESACTEEVTGEGAETIAEMLKEKGCKFEMVLDEGGFILTEPVAGAKGDWAMIGVGEKGCADIKFTARSKGGHASAPPKNTPLVRLGKFMSYMDRNEVFDVQISPVIQEMFKRIAPSMEGIKAKVMSDPEKYGVILKKIAMSVSPIAAALLKTTIAFTRCHGSEGNNVIPGEAYVIGNMRFSHHQGREKSLEAVKNVAKRYDIEMEVLDPGMESPVTDWRGKAFTLVEEGIKEIFPGVKTTPYIATGASDARYMSLVSDNCIRFVPFHVSDRQLASIHGVNENVDRAALEPAVEFYKYIITRF